jgi:hypothetical protein
MPQLSNGTLVTNTEWTRLIQSIPASYIIWKDGTDYYAECTKKGGTDYTDDDAAVVLQAAIDALPSGGRIHVRPGTYVGSSRQVLSGSIYACAILDSYLQFTGEGMANTILQVGDGIAANFFGADTKNYLGISDLTIDGNKDNNTGGGVDGNQGCIYASASNWWTFRNLEIKNAEREGLYYSNCGNTLLENVYAHGNTLNGIELDMAGLTMINNCQAWSNGLSGLDISTGTLLPFRNAVIGGIYRNNTQYGIKLTYAQHVDLTSVVAEVNGINGGSPLEGIYIVNSDDVSVLNCTSKENYRAGIMTNACTHVKIANCTLMNNNAGSSTDGDGIRLIDTTYSKAIDNDCYDTQGTPTQQYGIRTTGTSDYNQFRTNLVKGNAQTLPAIAFAGSHNSWDGKARTATSADLSGSATTLIVLHAEEPMHLPQATLLYTEASSADAGITLEIGKETDRDYYYTGTSETSKSQWYTKTVTLLKQDIAEGDTITFYSPGGKLGSGEVMLIIDYMTGA